MTAVRAIEAPHARTIKQSSSPTCFTKARRENNRAATQRPERTVKATADGKADAKVGILVTLLFSDYGATGLDVVIPAFHAEGFPYGKGNSKKYVVRIRRCNSLKKDI